MLIQYSNVRTDDCHSEVNEIPYYNSEHNIIAFGELKHQVDTNTTHYVLDTNTL